MNKTKSNSNQYLTRQNSTSWHAGLWALAWGLSIALCCLVIKFFSSHMPYIGIASFCISTGIGLGMIKANINLLKALDEMQRQIWLESLAIAFGVLWVSFGSLLILYTAEIAYLSPTNLLSVLTLFAGLVMLAAYLISWVKLR